MAAKQGIKITANNPNAKYRIHFIKYKDSEGKLQTKVIVTRKNS